jgi:large subunit ribosomal protein L25
MAELSIKATKRAEFKKSLSKQMRNTGTIPGIFYGGGEKNIPIAINELVLRPVIYTSESYIINLSIEGEEKPFSCILKNVQFGPLTDKPIHFDLLGLKEGEKLNLDVTIILKGAAVGIKDGGILQHTLHKLQVECLPQHIPSHIDVDISNLKIGDSVKVGDIKIEGVEILAEANAAIVSVVPPVIEKVAEEAVVEATTAEPEVITKGKKEEAEGK